VKGSYACYKVGQWTTIAGAEIEPVGNLLFAGEHCSFDYQGYMNGGAETGRRAAESIINLLAL
jgi:monoamine oxidase